MGTGEIFDGAGVPLQTACVESAVSRADKGKVIAGFFYLFPVDLSLKLRDIDSPADCIIVIALVMELAVIVIFEVLPVVVVEFCIQGKSAEMVLFPGTDIFLLCFGEGIVVILLFVFILFFIFILFFVFIFVFIFILFFIFFFFFFLLLILFLLLVFLV